MCRCVLYMGPEITLDVLTTRPTNSIINQSVHSRLRKEPLNGDGFGMAWYVPEVSAEPAQFRSIQPAWNNVNLLHLARVCRSSVILAHVRAATLGTGVSEANCHPFTSGRFAFMHNGSASGFPQLKRQLSQRLSDEVYSSIRGTTDSEHLFGLFLDHLSRTQSANETEAMANALEATIGEVVALTSKVGGSGESYVNLAVSDGTRAVVSRYATGDAKSPSLYTATGSQCVCEEGMCRMLQDGERASTVIVASEPLNDEPGWEPVPHNHLLLVYPDRSMRLRAYRMNEGTKARAVIFPVAAYSSKRPPQRSWADRSSISRSSG